MREEIYACMTTVADEWCRQLTVLEQKMNSDVMMILQVVRQSKLQQQVSSSSAAADAASSSGSLLNQTEGSSQVAVFALLKFSTTTTFISPNGTNTRRAKAHLSWQPY